MRNAIRKTMAQIDVDTTGSTSDLRIPLSRDSIPRVVKHLTSQASHGAAESRFRMPRGDGTLVEFDSYTEVRGEEFVTMFRRARDE
jgi:hypothetical protein